MFTFYLSLDFLERAAPIRTVTLRNGAQDVYTLLLRLEKQTNKKIYLQKNLVHISLIGHDLNNAPGR